MENKKPKIIIIAVIIVLCLLFVIIFMIEGNIQSKKLIDDSVPQINTEILGNKGDLVSLSIVPGQRVSGTLSVTGTVKGAYFFEANIVLNIIDMNKNILVRSHGNATTDWMTSEPVSFKGAIDLSEVAKGPAYLEIHNDNASGLPENDKSILIPIIIN